MRHRKLICLTGLILLQACNLAPASDKNACVTSADCISGYTCIAQACDLTTGASENANGAGPITADSGASTPQPLAGCSSTAALASLPRSTGAATHLVFLLQPLDAAVNTALCPVAAAYVDDAGGIDTTATTPIQIAVTGQTAALLGVTQESPTQGVVVFNQLRIVTAGQNQTLAVSGHGFAATSQTFAVHVPTWSQAVAFATPPWNLSITDDANKTVYAASDHAFCASRDQGATWPVISSNVTPYEIAINPAAPFQQYASTGSLQLSQNAGVTFTSACGNLSAADCAAVRPASVDPVTQAVVAWTDNHVIFSTDSGQLWHTVIDVGATTDGFYAVAMRNHRIYAAQARTHAVIVTDDIGATQSIITIPASHAGAIINDIAIDPQDTNTLYVAASDGLFVSLDGGVTYTQTINVCASRVSTVASEPTTHVYAILNDCPAGIGNPLPSPQFVSSSDAGRTWRRSGWGMQPQQPSNPPSSVDRCGVLLAADPQDAKHVYVSLGWCGGVYRTTSGGD